MSVICLRLAACLPVTCLLCRSFEDVEAAMAAEPPLALTPAQRFGLRHRQDLMESISEWGLAYCLVMRCHYEGEEWSNYMR
jgi:hypothetical protein